MISLLKGMIAGAVFVGAIFGIIHLYHPPELVETKSVEDVKLKIEQNKLKNFRECMDRRSWQINKNVETMRYNFLAEDHNKLVKVENCDRF